MNAKKMDGLCLCGSEKPYNACCGMVLDMNLLPESAESLMRSRYCAYVLGREDYLLATWHASTRPLKLELQKAGPMKWLGLKILSSAIDDKQNLEAYVEFVARYAVNGKAERLHETSRFVRENGKWFYIDGEIMPSSNI